MQQVQDQGDAERLFDQNLQSSLTVGDGHASLAALRIAALHLLGHLLNDGGLTFEQTGPYPLVLRARGSLIGSGRLTLDTEQTFHNLFGSAYPGRAGEHGGHGLSWNSAPTPS
jgi:hypothetical protein